MPPKPTNTSTVPPPVKKGPKGKGPAFELDTAPPSAGEGVFIHKDSHSKYEGQWQRFDGIMKRHGVGIYTDGGSTYDGHFVEDMYHGFGCYFSFEGSVYRGEWRNGLMHGHGTYTWADKSVYDGNWENGKMEGSGVFTDSEGHVWTGIWHEGNADLENLPKA